MVASMEDLDRHGWLTLRLHVTALDLMRGNFNFRTVEPSDDFTLDNVLFKSFSGLISFSSVF